MVFSVQSARAGQGQEVKADEKRFIKSKPVCQATLELPGVDANGIHHTCNSESGKLPLAITTSRVTPARLHYG